MSDSINWGRLAERMREVRRQLIHVEKYTGADYEAVILARTFGHTPAGEPGWTKRVLPYEQVDVPGLVTHAEMKHLLESHTIIDRMAREAAEKQVAEMRAEVQRVYAEHVVERIKGRDSGAGHGAVRWRWVA